MIQFILLSIFSINATSIVEVRELFKTAADVEADNDKLFEMTSGYTMDYKPIIYGYHAAAEMTKANHTLWPLAKLEHFNTGKHKLEKVITKYPEMAELRYIRYAVQNGSPDFLGYKGKMSEDKKYLEAHMDEQSWPSSFKATVKAVLEL